MASSLLFVALFFGQAHAFIDDLFRNMGGGGGGHHFGGGQQIPTFKWPKGTPKKIHKNFDWLKGTEWKWNNWRNVNFDHEGFFTAPTNECENEMCRWSATKDKIYVVWGEAGVHTLTVNEMKAEAGTTMSGTRKKDKEKCSATFVGIDEEAAELHKDLFAVLGLSDEASDAQIKKAYRKLSVKYHPDKNKDNLEAIAKFNEIRSAYEVLNDEDKRFLYETAGLKAVRDAEKEDASQAQHQGGLAAFFGGGQQQKKTKAKKGPDYTMQAKVSLDALYNGDQIEHSIKRRVVCKRCSNSNAERCKGCNPCPGGIKLVQKQMGNMIVQQQVNVPSKEKCKEEQVTLETLLERGMADGSEVKHQRMSEQKPGEIPGDVIITLKTKPHPTFKREGNNLKTTKTITLKDALVGFTSSIKHMDGRDVEFTRKSTTDPGYVHKIKGEGMPLHDDPSEKGDLYVTLKIKMPKKLNAEQKKAIEDLF